MENLAASVPIKLMNIALGIHELAKGVYETQKELGSLAKGRLKKQQDVPLPQGDIGHLLAVRLQYFDLDVRALVYHLDAVHLAAGRAFRLYAAHIGLDVENDESWRRWEARHADARRRVVRALRRLRVASAQARAFEDAVRSRWASPRGSEDWKGWLWAAARLLLYARISAKMAHRHLLRARRAVAREFFAAMQVLMRYLQQPGIRDDVSSSSPPA